MTPRGYAGRYLDVDLTKGETRDIAFPEETLEQYFGGRGLGAKILWERIGDGWSEVDPLGPENLFLALTGPMTGIYPGSRICVSGKSPESNGVVGSTAATELPVELRGAGYDGIIFTGKAEKPMEPDHSR